MIAAMRTALVVVAALAAGCGGRRHDTGAVSGEAAVRPAAPASDATAPSPPRPTADVGATPAPAELRTTGAPGAAPPPSTAGFAPAPLFAALFEEGRTWSYDARQWMLEGDQMDPEDGDLDGVETWTFACRVGEVRRFPAAVVARIECGEHAGPLGVGGIYVATGEGLRRLYDMPPGPSALAELAAGRVLLPPEPVMGEQYDEADGISTRWLVERHSDDGWCVTVDTTAGDQILDRICLEPGEGIVSADHTMSGGFEELTQARQRRAP